MTTSHITTPPASVATTIVVENDTSKSAPAALVTQNQAPAATIVTAASSRAVLTRTTYDGVGGSDLKSSVGVANEPATTDTPATADSLLDHVSSVNGQTVYQGKSVTKSQSQPSSHSPSSPSLTAPLGQSSKQVTSSGLFPLLSKSASETQSTAPSRTSPPTTVSLLVSARPSTPSEGHEGLGVGLVAATAVGGTLVALLLLGAAAYYCLKRRKARRGARLRALTLSRESVPGQGFEVPPEWKPPVELPHQNAAVSRPELEDSFVLRAQPSDSVSQSAPVTPSSLSAHSAFALRDAVEMQGVSPHPSPAELFVMPAELPGVPKI
ncbi:hypothetical protein EKO27_g3887 [Xylaria grammica]|uniref:Uncharacterized protein n=1 Tax=Xylaria grammica TaxID=363999 RepID=A0A439D9V0_9PEZI|nr:hypothetical protein EKO27_g3887 [Xylaria grammica]